MNQSEADASPENGLQFRVQAIQTALRTSLRVADLRCSLFIAALLTYRRPTCLKPFPPAYVCDGNKQYDRLMNLAKNIPPLNILLEKLNDENYVNSHSEIIDLLYYILIEISEPCLLSVSSDSFESVLKNVPTESKICKPQYIFEVINSPGSQNEIQWERNSKSHETFHAYHGSKFENFHSILHHGLQQHMNKTMLYGSGTYLSSELSLSLLYSPCGLNWENSCLGRYMSCIALCEVIDSPNGLVRQKSSFSKESTEQRQNSNNKAPDSMAGEIPHNYYIVYNNDLVRVRYLLVYAKEMPTSQIVHNPRRVKENFLKKWLRQYKFLSLMILYMGILISIGLRYNNSANYYYKIVWKKISNIFN